MGLAAYKKTIRDSETPRQVERRVLSQATYAMAEHADAYDRATETSNRLGILASGLRDALYANQRIWSAVRLDLADPENAMPDALKAQLISISLWVDRQSTAVMQGGGRVEGLLEINRNIIAGLAGQQPADPAALEEA